VRAYFCLPMIAVSLPSGQMYRIALSRALNGI
jgi:hypothetical protein